MHVLPPHRLSLSSRLLPLELERSAERRGLVVKGVGIHQAEKATLSGSLAKNSASSSRPVGLFCSLLYPQRSRAALADGHDARGAGAEGRIKGQLNLIQVRQICTRLFVEYNKPPLQGFALCSVALPG